MRPEWGHPKPTRGRRLLVISGVAVATLAVCALIGLFVVYPRVGASMVRDKMLPKLSARIGHTVAVDEIDVGLGRAELGGVTITDEESGIALATVPKVVMRFGVIDSLLGRMELESVSIHGPELVTVVSKDGSTSWDAMRAWISRKRGAQKAGGGRSGLIPKSVAVHDASYELRDHRRGVTAVGDGLAATLEGGKLVATTSTLTVMTTLGPRAELVDVTFRGRPRELSETAEIEIGDGAIALWSGMRLTGVAGTVAPSSSGAGLFVDLSGGWGGSEGRVWKAVGSFDPRTRHGELKVGAERFQLSRIANVLAETPLRDIGDTSIGGELLISSDGKLVSAVGNIEVNKLSFFHPRLSSETVEDLSFAGDVEASYILGEGELTVKGAHLRSGAVDYRFDGRLRRGDGRLLDTLEARIQIPEVACQAVLDSLPTAMVPKLQGFELDGKFATDLRVVIDWDKLEEAVLDGSIGIRSCKVLRAAKGMSAGKLKGAFNHRIIVRFDDGEPVYRRMAIGPKNSSYVALGNVSPHLVNSLLTTEDSSFFRHRGFIVSEFRTAMIKNIEAGYFRYGASSITMQLVKNVYLDRQKTVSRKLQELFMTWYVETKVKKARLMEVYVNAIEYGPALYGIGNAAERYFGKPASQLNPTEAAFFSSILPAPRRRYRQYCRDTITGWTERKIERILGLMLKRERITLEEYEKAMITPVLFRMDKKGCRGR